jgi:hypothetical protein
MSDYIPASARGETCGMCHREGKEGVPAAAKVEETIFDDDPSGGNRHALTQYVCRTHFAAIMGPFGMAFRFPPSLPPPKSYVASVPNAYVKNPDGSIAEFTGKEADNLHMTVTAKPPQVVVHVGPKSCNKHGDCSAAERAAAALGKPERYGPGSSRLHHCNDEGCEDCFGS